MWGNMFHVGSTIKVYTDTEIPDYISVTPIIAVELFRHRMNNVVEHFGLECFKDLRGKNLACFCPLDKPCHADVLLEIANK